MAHDDQHPQPNLRCPDCDGTDFRTENLTQHFGALIKDMTHDVKAVVPVRICNSCAFAMTDGEAEPIRDQAVKEKMRELGVPPRSKPRSLEAYAAAMEIAPERIKVILSKYELGHYDSSPHFDVIQTLCEGHIDVCHAIRERAKTRGADLLEMLESLPAFQEVLGNKKEPH